MKAIWIPIIFCLFSLNSLAQNRASHWMFSNSNHISFDENGAQTINYSNTINVPGGNASISDSCGNLLLYISGDSIRNAQHQIIPGSTLHQGSVLHAGNLIVPHPGNQEQFLIFSGPEDISDVGGSTSYSLVDLTLNAGQGGLVPGFINVHLADSTIGNLAGTRHANGKEFWVIDHKDSSDLFYTYRVLLDGSVKLDSLNIGQEVINGSETELPNYFPHFSPKGTQLAVAEYGPGILDLFSFRPSTGMLLNQISLPSFYQTQMEFSPSGNVLYSMNWDGALTVELFQWDLTAVNITSTKTLISNLPLGARGLKLAPDGKIYLSSDINLNTLSFINEPELLGAACDVQLNALPLNQIFSGGGFPNFISQFPVEDLCVLCQSQLNIQANTSSLNFDSYSSINGFYKEWRLDGAWYSNEDEITLGAAEESALELCLVVLNETMTCADSQCVNLKTTALEIGKFQREDFKLFPQPAEEVLNIQIPMRLEELKDLILVQPSGKKQNIPFPTHSTFSIPTSEYSPGLYILQIELKNGSRFIRKFIKI